jgi:SAM-dependent methyltransferase
MSFNHNDHYHRFLLRQVPPNARRALDVGCGSGRFARLLATRVASVDAVDRAPDMIAAARARGPANITYLDADIRDLDLDGYDYIASIAAIHHVPFAETVVRLRDALAPGGVLAILGLSRPTLPDLALSAIAFAPNRVRILTGRLRGTPPGPRPPIMDPTMTLPEIRAAAGDLLPGATIRRHLYWRYSLIYRR